MTIDSKENVIGVVLAAGKGSRMKSELPKVLTEAAGKPLLLHVLDNACEAGITEFVIVIGYKKELVMEAVNKWKLQNEQINLQFAEQVEQKGTGHAVKVAEPYVPHDEEEKEEEKEEEEIIILLGDVPSVRASTITMAFDKLHETESSAIVISMSLDDPSGYGRILRNENGTVAGIKEEKDANEEEKKIKEVNSGIFIFKSSVLWKALEELNSENAQSEYYLTDTVAILNNMGETVSAWNAPDAAEFLGVNSPTQLAEIDARLRA